MKKLSALILIILLTSLSCSRLDLAVNLANSYITKKTDDFFDLTWDQKSWLKEALAKDISIIKKTIFPILASEMLKAAETLSSQKTFDTATVLSRYNRLEEIYYEGLKLLIPTAKILVTKLASTQIEYFQKQADKKFIEMKDDSDKKSYKKMKKNFDSWMGGLTSGQKDELKVFLQKNPSPVKEIIIHRQHLVDEFIKVYPDSFGRAAFLEGVFTKNSITMNPNYKKMIEDRNKNVAAFFTHFLNTMSASQKQTLIDTIKDRANQIIKISKK